MDWKNNLKEFYYKWEDRAFQWIHENPSDKEQIKNRALIIAIIPVTIGAILGLIISVVNIVI